MNNTKLDAERALQAARAADGMGWTQRERECFESGFAAARSLPAQASEPVAWHFADGEILLESGTDIRLGLRKREDGKALVYAAATPAPAQGEIAKVCAYRLTADSNVRIEEARQMVGPSMWAVRWNVNCLNKQGEWEWEPMPSGRDDDFLARCRFASAQEAIDAALSSQPGKGEA